MTDANAGPAFRSGGYTPGGYSKRQIIVATLVALVVASVVLVVGVLPAEYGIDPIGIGSRLGLVQLAQVRPGALMPQTAEHRLDSSQFILGPFQFMEYKYRIEKGGTMVYSWNATGRVMSELHSEPDGSPKGYAETFEKVEGTQGYGAYTAPFSGIHGWYWENVDKKDVTITLATAGFYSGARETVAGGQLPHELTDLRGRKLPPAPVSRTY